VFTAAVADLIKRTHFSKGVTFPLVCPWLFDTSYRLWFHVSCIECFRREPKFSYTGMQARHILSQTGLSQMILAKIWQLSDIDNDGKLTQEEFMLALHLSDMAKSGQINLKNTGSSCEQCLVLCCGMPSSCIIYSFVHRYSAPSNLATWFETTVLQKQSDQHSGARQPQPTGPLDTADVNGPWDKGTQSRVYVSRFRG